MTIKKAFTIVTIFMAALPYMSLAQFPQYNNEHISSPQLTPPSLEAIALARYAAVPVGYYTGIPDINIPLFTFQGKDISLPIALRYHSFRGDTSWVGKSWTVEGGG